MAVIGAINIDETVECQNSDNQKHWTHYPVTLDNWIEACHEEKLKRKISYAEIARRIKYARPSLSLALSGNYIGDTKTIA
ncbi:hypothetical protein, partial [Psychrobacter sp. I-STPA6b]